MEDNMTNEFKMILASSNKDKAREIAEILNGTPFVVTTMKELILISLKTERPSKRTR